MPVAYLLGRREFYSLSFQVSPEVLIPRPQTEDLVVRLLDVLSAHPTAEVVDVGTGSGIIAVCAAHLAPTCKVLAVDISPGALAVAEANARQLGVIERVEFAQSDLLASVAPERTFQVVVSNPPYVAESEMAALAKDVREYEPRGALVGGPTGTEVIARLIPQAADHLLPRGWLLMEISPQIQAAVEQLLQAEPRLEPHPTLKDAAGRARVAQAQRRA
jgi:release factor glutamine methyltransferase